MYYTYCNANAIDDGDYGNDWDDNSKNGVSKPLARNKNEILPSDFIIEFLPFLPYLIAFVWTMLQRMQGKVHTAAVSRLMLCANGVATLNWYIV